MERSVVQLAPHTMNIQKYLIPVSVAATVHVALFWFMPQESYTRLIEVPLGKPPRPHAPVEQPADEPEKPDRTSEEVKPLLGALAPVALDEPPLRLVETAFPMPVENIRPEVAVDTRNLPTIIGDPLGDRNGKLLPEGSIFAVDLDRTPRAKAQIPPEYPYAMKQAGASGTVTVEFAVDKSGRVTRAEAVNYTNRDFVEPALRAVRQWRFEPGRKDGKVVPFRMVIPIEFGIDTTN
jgi:protein TonB